MNRTDLNKNWKMHEAPLKWGKGYEGRVLSLSADWYSLDLPADVRMPLLEKGVIKEPLVADQCRESEWIGDRSWWFVKRFDGSDVDMKDDIIELVLEGLDTRADIFLNGTHIGAHRSVHYPFIYDVKPYILPDENVLTVRMTSGLEEVSQADMAELDHAVCLESHNGGEFRGDERRAFVRRPQYTVGWDWGPKVITIGITGTVYLRGYRKIAIREVQVETKSIGETARLHAMVNVENLSFISTRGCDVEISLWKDGICRADVRKEEILITSGYNYIDLDLKIDKPELWWPNGCGEQPLYTVEVSVACDGAKEHYPSFRYGIRMLELNTDTIEGEDRNFTVVVNGKPIFCKGGNWIPNDFIYARVPEEKYHVLTDEAVEANFNMLRIWGGGLYERDIFYRLCDEKGLLIWHDLMFACSTYPDHRAWFREEMQREFDYQTKRLRNHASIALYCGTNEVHWIFNSTDNPRWGIEFSYEHQYGLAIANQLAKEVIRHNCPQIPYWNSSPYGGALPNDDTVGDVHRWHNALMSLKMEERIEPKDYDTIESKFVSEYGFIGPCSLATTRAYMGMDVVERDTPVWKMHSNVFEKDTVYTAIEKQYVDNSRELDMEEYILYGGMVHGLMYGYSLEAMRFKQHCSGGLFWMYNDAWGEVGWTVIDYYLRRKIPYYAVKRALAHRKFTMRAADGNIVLQGLNDTPETLCVKGRFGYVSFDGRTDLTREIELEVAPGSREWLLEEELPDEDFTKGTMMLYTEDEEIDNIWLRLDDMRNLDFQSVQPQIIEEVSSGIDKILTVRADSFIHGVYVKEELECSDNYFDLLPGETKTITVNRCEGKVMLGTVR